MHSDKQKAIGLRLTGKTYTEISKVLHIPKSTLSGWLHSIELSGQARERIAQKYKIGSYKGLLQKAKLQTEMAIARSVKTRLESEKDIIKIGDKELFLIGLGLYLGEGHKKAITTNGIKRTYHPVSLSNSDPLIVKLFIKFLIRICQVDKERIKLSIHMYSRQDEQKAKIFWIETTQLPGSNFRQSYFGVSKASKRKKPHNHLPNGTLKITVHDTMLYHRIMGWLNGLNNLV